MTTAWLAITGAFSFMALLAVWSRRPTAARPMSVIALPVAAAIAWYALTVPLGQPSLTLPAGEYTILGARIDVPAGSNPGAIYVLLDGDEPRYHRLPYSNEVAEQLQRTMDAGNGVLMDTQEGGAPQFHEAPVGADAPKQPERPALEIGG